ncbi:MAG TPA: hypothetical protein GX505_04985 [Clostridiales bacterium]|nr:hypothetical protein [Clostridiales bacterium]
MKLLKKLLLIHWHYFNYELINFDRINFLTGKNASGKTTIIDAIQLLMLGDANGRHFFNKAANEKSARSLKGYLRGELGDDGGTGFKYLREGRFTSYIACEFFDDVKKSSFTLGVVFDCYEDGTEEHRFFVLDSELPDNHFIVNSTPLTYKELRTFVNKNYKKGKYDFPDSDRGFQEIIKGKLGGLKNKYFSLFKKAVSFTPITDIEKFITEYVCDVKNPVDISLMQDNIRYYKRLEYEADLMEARISELQRIADKYNSYIEEKQRLEIQSYIVDRAMLQVALDEKEKLNEEIKRLDIEIVSAKNRQAECLQELASQKEERDRLIADKLQSDIYNKMEQLKSRKNNILKRFNELNANIDQTVQKLRKYAYEWRIVAKKCTDLKSFPDSEIKDLFSNDILSIRNLAAMTVTHASYLLDINHDNIKKLTEQELIKIIEDTSQLKQASIGLIFSIEKKMSQFKADIQNLNNTLIELEKGIKAYNPKLISLQNEIKKVLTVKYGREISVYILADLLDIRDMRWRNAVEAYLHTQKFYLLVEPQYFIDALKVYDRLKFKMGFYDWGIIDTDKLERIKPQAEKISLAEEVETGNTYARMFIDYVMGRVIKCDKVEDLRNYGRAITDTCMLYQGYVARQLNPERWKYPFIGRIALEEQKKNITMSIEKCRSELEICKNAGDIINSAANIAVFNNNEAEHYLKIVESSAELQSLKMQLDEVVYEIEKLDLTWLKRLDEIIKECDENIKRLEEYEKKYNTDIIIAQKDKQLIINEKLPASEEEEKKSRYIIESRYEASWISDKGEPRFLKELQNRKSAKEIINNFSSQIERTKNQTAKKKDELELARSEYNRKYKMAHDIKQEDNAPYRKELEELKVIRLPEYRKQIRDAREKAFQQFEDDFLAKLKSNIDTVKSQIDELNSALKESSWGKERYRFVSSPRLEYKKYYDMITDEMLMEGHNIASQVFRDKHRDAIDELFRQIIDIDAELNADARAELEKNIKRFTDYRTYLSFDLVVTDEEDRTQRLSKTLQKKSGGETQTPFYISVLASFAQLYRIHDQAYNRIRLIVFDEAFSKMDSERIQESIRLLRKFGFQCILSAPPEKISDIAPLVDRNICVYREKTSSFVRAFDSKKLMEEDLYVL